MTLYQLSEWWNLIFISLSKSISKYCCLEFLIRVEICHQFPRLSVCHRFFQNQNADSDPDSAVVVLGYLRPKTFAHKSEAQILVQSTILGLQIAILNQKWFSHQLEFAPPNFISAGD